MAEDILGQMEADISRETTTLGRRGFAALPGGFSENVVPIGASAVSKRLEDLLAQADELSKQAEILAVALAGPAMPGAKQLQVHGGKAPVSETLFSKQLGGLDDLGRVLDTLGRSLERANRSLA